MVGNDTSTNGRVLSPNMSTWGYLSIFQAPDCPENSNLLPNEISFVATDKRWESFNPSPQKEIMNFSIQLKSKDSSSLNDILFSRNLFPSHRQEYDACCLPWNITMDVAFKTILGSSSPFYSSLLSQCSHDLM